MGPTRSNSGNGNFASNGERIYILLLTMRGTIFPIRAVRPTVGW